MKQKLKHNHLVLFFTRDVSLQTWDINGSLEREVAIYHQLVKKGWQVSFVTYGNDGDLKFKKKLGEIQVLCNQWGLPQAYYENNIHLLHAPALARADIFKTNQINGAEIALAAAKYWKKPLVVRCGYLWSIFLKQLGRQEEYQRACNIETKVFNGGTAVVVTTAAMQDYILNEYQVPIEKINIIPNYVQTDIFSPPKKLANTNKITFIGRLAPQKNTINMVKGCAGLDVELQIIGEGPQKLEMLELAKYEHVKLNMLGNLPNQKIPEVLHTCTAFLLPSLFEGHPKALIEAMSCGLPVIGANVPGIREIIRHNENGYLCETNAKSIHDAIQAVLADRNLRENIGRNARRFVENNYALEIILKKELAVLQNTISKNTSTSKIFFPYIIILTLLARFKARLIQCIFFPVRITRKIVRLFKNVIKNSVNVLFKVMVKILRANPEKANSLISKLIESHIHHLPPKEALIFLLNLDTRLYGLEGIKSVEYGNGLHSKHRHIDYYRFFKDHITDKQSVLDLGCGNGALTFNIAQKTTGKVTGLELSGDNLQIARRDYQSPNITYLQGDIYELLPSEHFDVIVLSNVLEHLTDRVSILQKIKEKNTPNKILLRVPLFERDWRVPLKKELGLEWRLDPTHEIEYTQESFKAEIEKAGLCIKYQETRWGEIWAEVSSVESKH